jgi:uncharacterized membrane protein (DUF106 family)
MSAFQIKLRKLVKEKHDKSLKELQSDKQNTIDGL